MANRITVCRPGENAQAKRLRADVSGDDRTILADDHIRLRYEIGEFLLDCCHVLRGRAVMQDRHLLDARELPSVLDHALDCAGSTAGALVGFDFAIHDNKQGFDLEDRADELAGLADPAAALQELERIGEEDQVVLAALRLERGHDFVDRQPGFDQ